MKVELTYFKPNGKFYSEGYYDIDDDIALHQIWLEVRDMKERGNLPDIYGSDWIVSVDVPEHPHNHPHLIV